VTYFIIFASSMNKLFLTIIILGSISLNSCQYFDKKKPNDTSDISQNPPANFKVDFDENLAYTYIDKQVSFGPRSPGSAGHAACAAWIMEELKKMTDSSYVQEFDAITYDGKKYKGKNLIAKLNPANTNRILLCAHWDTRPIADHDSKDQSKPILGANDAGSGVGIILSILDNLKKNKSTMGVDIVFFDIEDYGQPENSGLPPMENSWCLGSQYWGKNYSEMIRPRWGILLDMVGGKNATFLKEELSMQYASNLQNRIWNNAESLGFKSTFIPEAMSSIQDDHLYVNTLTGIPTVDIIHYKQNNGGFADYWHTHNDNMNSVDKSTLKIVGTSVLYTMIEESMIGQ
jgi:hypothetical protein